MPQRREGDRRWGGLRRGSVERHWEEAVLSRRRAGAALNGGVQVAAVKEEAGDGAESREETASRIGARQTAGRGRVD
jgi:hypothetical protein